jgi:hypothetical protein
MSSGSQTWNIYTPGPASNDYHYTLLKKDITSSGGNIEEYSIEVICNASDTSNIVDYRIYGSNIEKESLSSSSNPVKFGLNQNFPNPFNPYTIISFSLADKQYVKLKIYDLTGSEIKTLISGEYEPGIYKIEFNGSDLSSGVYFYRITAGNFSESKKLQVLK